MTREARGVDWDGIPVILPVDGFRVNPDGRVPDWIEKVSCSPSVVGVVTKFTPVVITN